MTTTQDTAARSAEPALRITDLTVRYREVLALDSASLTLDSGRVCGLVGMNGSGKSSMFKAVMGVVKPSSGDVVIRGVAPAIARRRALVSYVPQSESVDWTFPISVREVVMMGRYGKQNWLRRPRQVDRDAVAMALEQVELTDLADRQIGRLSGGQRKRAFVARAIAQEASVLLLDEPFAGVDKRTEATITRLLRSLAADGAAVLVSTHDLHGLPELCDEAVLIQKRVLVHGTPDEVLRPENLARAFGADPLAGSSRDNRTTADGQHL
ncbi:metal ABC transporter ATP-binding protein [Antrihabitans sp. YC3-6]|uniref:Metal ABC transporter ATP-binding protein n=1 Tax=Antrihabitans stalagmiti TaxID=2799499 RepID=A0A934U5M1_9NOCA|nr:metal ABC transporter ATP-binding protein [Antrihabitans stalagmiti]MBJ8341507.1 metal ABC transporter ATP-binding protein [Antrihabitans stalagmiti]